MKQPIQNRRSFLKTISQAGALTAGFHLVPQLVTATGKVKTLTDESNGFAALPYLQYTGPDSICISWITDKPAFSWVAYGKKGSGLELKKYNETEGLIEAYNTVNSVIITGLQPDTEYEYKIVSKEITKFQPYSLAYGNTPETPVYSFKTAAANAKEVSWLVFNDIHDRPQSIPHLLGLNKGENFDYAFFNGDMFDYQTDEQQIIDHFLKPCSSSFATTTPFLFVRGNHETRGKFARNLKNYLGVKNTKGYYAYQYGPVFNIIIDTGEDKKDEHPVYAGIVNFDAYRQEQALWLEQVMKSKAYKKSRYKVVMMHIPPFHSDEEHGTVQCRMLFAPLFEKYKIDALICGHTHRHGLHLADKDHSYPVIIGGGPRDGRRTLIKAKATGSQLSITMLDDAGQEIGKVVK